MISALTHEGEGLDWRIVFRLYRGPFLVILFIFLIGINVYGWRSSGKTILRKKFKKLKLLKCRKSRLCTGMEHM